MARKDEELEGLHSPKPWVRLRNHFPDPFREAIAAARTCYSDRFVTKGEVSEEELKSVGRTTYEGGHHSVYQHAYFEFELGNVSRALVHDFLHAQPFYNTSQQSQRYVLLKEPSATIPPFKEARSRRLYCRLVKESWKVYWSITRTLEEELGPRYRVQELSPRASRKMKREIREKAMEAARYALCIGAHTFLLYTIDGVTLWRFYRTKELHWEAKEVVERMVEEVKRVDPSFMELVEREGSLNPSQLPEFQGLNMREGDVERFILEFDEELEGRRSKLVEWSGRGEELLAQAVREVLGVSKDDLSDDEAIDLVLNPRRNRYLADTLNLSMVSPLTRSLCHLQYTFKKKLSHTADSQDQRHRTIPASRPLTFFTLTKRPDYITPLIIERSPAAKEAFDAWMEELWEGIAQLLEGGVPAEQASYALPQAVAIRFHESGSLLYLWYKYMNRSCLRAEEEIWRVTMEEVEQIREVHPRVGMLLGPPCYIRKLAAGEDLPEHLGRIRYCNQGRLYCRQPVWQFYPNVTEENILRVL